mmetsp:Transcript_27415/g.80629  ORF Transcript_27415/g.80629 Transcript_27415/m.80629 type:complete len:91 (+) Transcript_27415:487-759(+)
MGCTKVALSRHHINLRILDTLQESAFSQMQGESEEMPIMESLMIRCSFLSCSSLGTATSSSSQITKRTRLEARASSAAILNDENPIAVAK